MRVNVSLNGAGPVIQALEGGAQKIRFGWQQAAFQVGARAVALMQAERRAITAVRSGAAVRSYGFEVATDGQGVTLAAGAIKPGPDGQVDVHVRVQEGFNAKGQQVDHFDIAPIPPNQYLHFPIRSGGGLGASSIVGWVRTKHVTLYPTPVVIPIGKQIPGALRLACGQVFGSVLRGN